MGDRYPGPGGRLPAAFGEEPPAIVGVAIMTDADNTGVQATAWYGDLTLVK